MHTICQPHHHVIHCIILPSSRHTLPMHAITNISFTHLLAHTDSPQSHSHARGSCICKRGVKEGTVVDFLFSPGSRTRTHDARTGDDDGGGGWLNGFGYGRGVVETHSFRRSLTRTQGQEGTLVGNVNIYANVTTPFSHFYDKCCEFCAAAVIAAVVSTKPTQYFFFS